MVFCVGGRGNFLVLHGIFSAQHSGKMKHSYNLDTQSAVSQNNQDGINSKTALILSFQEKDGITAHIKTAKESCKTE